jgi:hypothetical protein
MMQPLDQLEALLGQLIAEHQRLLAAVDSQQGAMKALDLAAMEAAARAQDSARQRVAAMETRRRLLMTQLVPRQPGAGEPTLQRLAERYPIRAAALLRLREELRAVMQQVAERNAIAGRLAGALLGHMNTVVRLLAGAVEQSGVYTKDGVPRVARRIGAMEAVG